MTKKTITIQLQDEDMVYTAMEICQRCNISKDILVEFFEHGLFVESSETLDDVTFNQQTLARLQAALRLHHDLEVNVPGVVLALELLDELETLRKELQIFQHHIELTPK